MKRIAKIAAALLLAGSLGWEEAHAQLAITEVMAHSSSNTNTVPTFSGPDFWELTNFGAKDIDLKGYSFSDNTTNALSIPPVTDLVIGAGESIIFCRSVVDSPVVANLKDFRAWWGETNLPADLKVRFYGLPVRGFDANAGDEVWLRDPSSNVVDMVKFGASLPGRTFAYDRETGVFGPRSVPGVDGAFRAVASTNDVGSPGFTTSSVPLVIQQQPVSQTVDGCGNATFSVAAVGLPRPRFQWTFNGTPITDATGPTLVIPGVQPANAGTYSVVLTNGLMQMTSGPAILRVNKDALAPSIVRPPMDTTVFPGQTAFFSVETRGFPCLQYQWQKNGVAMDRETNSTLEFVVPLDAPLSSTAYTVTAWNGSGSAKASARLVVIRRPCLSITELMSVPAGGGMNWFELTNCDTDAVDLRGYRFRDAPALGVASVITNAVVIKPGESVVFVEFMSPAEFRQWWGAERLPPGLQIVTWGGWGLSSMGNDVIHVWNPGATHPLDTVATASHLPPLAPGVSEELENFCDSTNGCVASFPFQVGEGDSQAGKNGAFTAEYNGPFSLAKGEDVGSPGYTANPLPRFLGLTYDAEVGVALRFRVVEKKTYRLHFKNTLRDDCWTLRDDCWRSLIEFPADRPIMTLSDLLQGDPPRTRFYRLEERP